jgi:hypothetical protein
VSVRLIRDPVTTTSCIGPWEFDEELAVCALAATPYSAASAAPLTASAAGNRMPERFAQEVLCMNDLPDLFYCLAVLRERSKPRRMLQGYA